MKSSSLLWIVAAAALAASLAGHVVQARERAALDRLSARLDALSDRAGAGAADPAPARDAAQLAELEHRLARIEGGLERTAIETGASAAPAPEPAAEASSAEEPAAEKTDGVHAAGLARDRAELAGLLREIVAANYDYGGLSDELERFYELARGGTLVDDAIAELEARVAADPADVAARMELADWYVAKLMTVGGPEQGLWGSKAERQWEATVALDERNWRARFTLGQNYSYYPDAMGKQSVAIEHLEAALALQQELLPEPPHAQTYLLLANLYRADGRVAEARALLEEGVATFPHHEALQEALAGLPH